jgi:hypothetical protein
MTEHRTAASTIIASELREELEKINDLEECLKLAFRRVQNHWMFTDKNDQFAAAVAAVGIRFGIDSSEFERLRKAMDVQKRGVALIGALQAGIPVDLESLAESVKNEMSVIPLNKLWWDAVEAR